MERSHKYQSVSRSLELVYAEFVETKLTLNNRIHLQREQELEEAAIDNEYVAFVSEYSKALAGENLFMYMRESLKRNDKIFVRVMAEYFKEWSKNKEKYQFPEPPQIFNDIEYFDEYKTSAEGVNFCGTKAYWRRLSYKYQRSAGYNLQDKRLRRSRRKSW